MGVVQRTRS